jgi:hypothetical protein
MTFELNPVAIVPFLWSGYNRLEAITGNKLAAEHQVGKDLLFPACLLLIRDMLPLAATARTEKRARWLTSQWRRLNNLTQLGLNVSAFGFDNPAVDPVSGNRQGHEYGLAFITADPPASMDESTDFEVFDEFVALDDFRHKGSVVFRDKNSVCFVFSFRH